jgi:hypothetical protein
MMLPTHVLVGLAMGAPLLAVAPDLAGPALAGAAVGSALPDMDMYAGHRRTLHYPTGYVLAAVPAVLLAGLLGTPFAVALALAVVGAAIHCRMDRYGGGLELRPWEGTSERAVYDHVRGAWRPPKRWIRYDGAPEDVALAVGLAMPLVLVVPWPARWVVGVSVGVGLVYGLLRRHIVRLAPIVVDAVPRPFEGHVPERYRQ